MKKKVVENIVESVKNASVSSLPQGAANVNVTVIMQAPSTSPA